MKYQHSNTCSSLIHVHMVTGRTGNKHVTDLRRSLTLPRATTAMCACTTHSHTHTQRLGSSLDGRGPGRLHLRLSCQQHLVQPETILQKGPLQSSQTQRVTEAPVTLSSTNKLLRWKVTKTSVDSVWLSDCAKSCRHVLFLESLPFWSRLST